MNAVRQFFRPERIRETSLLVLIIAIVLIFNTQIPNYLEARTFNRISSSVMIIMVMAVGEVLVILTRNIDLSIGSIVGFTAFFVGRQIAGNNDLPPLVLILMAMSVGAIMGMINGLLTAYGKVPAIVVTLGTLAIYRAFLVEYGGGQTVTTSSLPQWLNDLARVDLFTVGKLQIRLLFSIAVVAVIVFQIALAYLPFGRRLYAIGSNPDAARIAGMPIRRITLLAYILCGAMSGLAGFMYLAQYGNITVVAAQGLELQVVAAAVVGGISINGGTGTMIGAALGAILIGTIEQSLIRMANISEFWKDALLGLFILVAVVSDALILNRIKSIWSRSARKQRLAEAANRSAQ
ncbi:MAG: ABC transporter permease [Anaerolineae bacterium]|nr:ABC transporter permease [Anaerolineae bacterium]